MFDPMIIKAEVEYRSDRIKRDIAASRRSRSRVPFVRRPAESTEQVR